MGKKNQQITQIVVKLIVYKQETGKRVNEESGLSRGGGHLF